MILNILVTAKNFVIDFGDFKLITDKGYIKDVYNIEWYENCIMIDTDGGLESIGIEHLIYGEPPLYTSTETRIVGNFSKECLDRCMKNITRVEWRADDTCNEYN